MADIFLHKYNTSDSLSAYTAPQRLRSSKGLKMGDEVTVQIIKAWNNGKNKVLKQLTSKIKEQCDTNEKYGFILAPSHTKLFYNDMLSAVKNDLPDAIDFSDCFQKIGEVNAVNTNMVLSEAVLRERFNFDKECFLSKYDESIKFIILIDDVYSLGNTFNGIKLLINDIIQNINYKTAVILKTNE